MASDYLSSINETRRQELIKDLWEIQKGLCFITEKPIDLVLHKNDLDIDHIVPKKMGGKDDKSNFALTFASANRSKQASDLKLARILYSFQKLKEELDEKEDRNPNLNDLLQKVNGSKFELSFIKEKNTIKYSFSSLGKPEIIEVPFYKDDLSKLEYFFACFPIEYLYHDEVINPRSIGDNISKLVDEFYHENPQLHISLAWIDISNSTNSKIRIFDGQHKAAAQILLGVRTIPVRIFINPDKDKLILTNFRAGTTLKQIAFDKSIQRHLGNTLYRDRVERYQKEHELDENNLNFSEKALINHFKGESREMKRYILDAIRDSITHNPDNKLTEFIDFGGRAKEKPLSYSTIEKTFYSFFIYLDALDTPISYRLEEGKNPRELEKSQILQLMNIIAEEIYLGKFDLDIGTYQIENKIQKGEKIDSDHVRAYRMSKEEIIYTWLKFVEQIVYNYFAMKGMPIKKERLFQYEFDIPLWNHIRNFIKNLGNLPLWVNNELSSTVFGGKQNYSYWQSIFETGQSPFGVKVLTESINLIKMIQVE
jgi:hypothetical protein